MTISTGGAYGAGEVQLGGSPPVVVTGGGLGGRVGPSPDGNGLRVGSSFGLGQTSFDDFKARSFIESERVKMLARRESYYRATHHDWKMFDFDGRMIPPGPPTSQPLLSADIGSSYYVPLKLRRPSSPYRLARVIVNSFTTLLFGYQRWPTIRVHGDPRTEDFANALAEACKLRTVMIRARNLGGSSGTVGLSWKFWDGKPCVLVHNGKHLYVHEWVDREQLIPAHVSEVYTYSRDEFDPSKGKYVKKWYWYRRDWTPDADLAFLDVEYRADQDPVWVLDEAKCVEHNDGKAHFIWIQNLPEDDGASEDGQPDYAELYENFESLDLLKSVIVRGATLNLDPTLVLKLDPDIVQRVGIKKGSDNSLIVGKDGDAKYMELGGTSITMGTDLFQKMREAALEVAQCVVPDPNQVGSAGTSAVALKVIYEPMIAKAEVLRVQYGDMGVARLLADMIECARKRTGEVDISIDENGEEVETKSVIDLPPRYDLVNVEDGNGNRTEELRAVEREPGEGGRIELVWGDYFTATADDQTKTVTTITTAVAGKVLSRQSGADEIATMFGRNPREEWKRLEDERQATETAIASAFADASGSAGGLVTETVAVEESDEEETGVEPAVPAALAEAERAEVEAAAAVAAQQPAAPVEAVPVPKVEKQSDLAFTGTDLASITTVNEARQSVGLPILTKPDGTPDPEGNLTIAEFKAIREARGAAVGEIVGEAAAQKQVGPIPQPEPGAAAPVAGAPPPEPGKPQP